MARPRTIRLLLVLVALLALTKPGHGAACMSTALLAAKLAAYGARATALGIPRVAVECVSRSVYASRFQSVFIGPGRISCIDEQKLGHTMGVNLARCMRAASNTNAPFRANMLLHGSQAKQPPSPVAAPAAVRQVTRVPAVPKHLTRVARLIYDTKTALKVAARWNCEINRCHCYCDSGCHFCCSYTGVGIPGQPGAECFEEAGCPAPFVQCN